MGPRLVSRGNDAELGLLMKQCEASMGPRLVSRGNCAWLKTVVAPDVVLQWGRDSLVAEISLFLRS